MQYNGKELIEMTQEQWNGKSRQMLVWDDTSKTPLEGIVVGYCPQDNCWMAIGPYSEGCSWEHCAEIPNVENRVKIKPKCDFIENKMDNNEQTFDEIIDNKSEIPKQIYYGECTKLIFDDGNEKFEIDANVTVFNDSRITLSNFKMDDRLNIGRKFCSIDLKLKKGDFGCTMTLYNCYVNSVVFGSEITIVGDYYIMLV